MADVWTNSDDARRRRRRSGRLRAAVERAVADLAAVERELLDDMRRDRWSARWAGLAGRIRREMEGHQRRMAGLSDDWPPEGRRGGGDAGRVDGVAGNGGGGRRLCWTCAMCERLTAVPAGRLAAMPPRYFRAVHWICLRAVDFRRGADCRWCGGDGGGDGVRVDDGM